MLHLAVPLGLLQQAPQLVYSLASEVRLEEHLRHAVATGPRAASSC